MTQNSIPFFDHRAIHDQLNKELLEAYQRVLHSTNIMLGEEVKRFEENIGLYLDTKYAIGVNSGLDALVISLRALGIGPDHEVIVPSNTYVATWLAVTMVGASPVPVEPDIDDFNIDVNLITEKINTNTKAIMPVHLFGLPCDMMAILEISKQYNLFVIEDNAQSFGAHINNKKTGSFGKINGHSFYPTKNLGAIGDAGIISTDDEELFHQCKMLRNYGSKEKYVNEVVGYNSRLDELQAAILNVKMKFTTDWILEKRKTSQMYLSSLKGIGDIILPTESENHTYHLFVIKTDFRDELKKHLESKNISTLIHYPLPPHLQKIYINSHASHSLPISESIANTCLSLPNFIGMKEEQIERVIDAIKEFFS